MAEPLTPEILRERLQDTIADAVRPEMVTKWIVIVETIDADGTRGLWTSQPASMRPWEELGMLQYASDHVYDDEDDDE